ncbi:hypothetical protein AcV5_003301 [Taiwanofungus camphoratus]|nr:hypothetical protein AcV5_003301 [Antrodia cinnamomea]
MLVTISSIPEELLERILEYVLTPASPHDHLHPSWHSSPSVPCSTPSRLITSMAHTGTCIAPFLVSHTWLRIATPLYYRHVFLRSPRGTALLAGTLRMNPHLGYWVRAIKIEGTFDALVGIVDFCPNLEIFDTTVDNGIPSPVIPGPRAQVYPLVESHARLADKKVLRFCDSFTKMHRIKHLAIRKNAYLTQPRPTLIFEHLGKAISKWRNLESVNIAFRFSPSPASASFAASLAIAPKLQVVRALLPAVWNNTLLEISANPALERIQLTPDTELIGAHLFLAEARKHPRLIELIRAGTPIMRSRAQTMTALTASPTDPDKPAYPPSAQIQNRTVRAGARSGPAGRLDSRTSLTLPGAPLLLGPVPQIRNPPTGRRMSAV